MITKDTYNQTYYFSIRRITKDYPDKLIYSVCLNESIYYISKTIAANDFFQIDNHPKLDTVTFSELCEVLSEIEPLSQRRPCIDSINQHVFSILSRIRSVRFKII